MRDAHAKSVEVSWLLLLWRFDFLLPSWLKHARYVVLPLPTCISLLAATAAGHEGADGDTCIQPGLGRAEPSGTRHLKRPRAASKCAWRLGPIRKCLVCQNMTCVAAALATMHAGGV